MGERRRYELYTALERFLEAEPAAYLMHILDEIQRNPLRQRGNRERIVENPELSYRLYARFHAGLGAEPTATFFELFDPIGWRTTEGGTSTAKSPGEVAPVASGRNHGGQ